MIDYLAFAPHPDDIEIFAGGTLIRAASRGCSTAVIDMTQGELGSQGSVAERKQEALAASKILGLSHRENAGIPDGFVWKDTPSSSKMQQLQLVAHSIRRLKPRIVLAPYWACRHPDHGGTSNLVTEACFYAALRKFDTGHNDAPHAVTQVLYYQMRYSFRPSFLVDISAALEKKYEAIACYKSQVLPRPQENSGLQTLVGSPRSVSSMRVRDEHHGSMIGVLAAEPFLVKNAIRIDDPLAVFTANQTNEIYLFPEAS